MRRIRGPHAFVVAFTVGRAGPAGYGAATHNTTQYKYSFRKDRSEECTRSHRVVHVRHSQTFPTCSTLLSRTHIMLRDERVLGVSCKIEMLDNSAEDFSQRFLPPEEGQGSTRQTSPVSVRGSDSLFASSEKGARVLLQVSAPLWFVA